jgi:hypothetical protein
MLVFSIWTLRRSDRKLWRLYVFVPLLKEVIIEHSVIFEGTRYVTIRQYMNEIAKRTTEA